MTDNTIKIIIDGKDAASPAIDSVNKSLSNTEKAIAGTRTTILNLDKDLKVGRMNLGSTADMMGALGISIPVTPMAALGQGIRMVGDEIKAGINQFMAYTDQVRDLSSYTGMSAEETSRFIQVADDLFIEMPTLELAFKSMVKNGITPNVEELGKLSDQYLAIKDPLQAAAFLTDNFGRSGQDMAKMMLKGRDGIKEMYNSVEDSLIITQLGLEKATEYKQALDAWNDSIAGVKYQFVTGLIPTLIQVMGVVQAAMTSLNQLIQLAGMGLTTISPARIVQTVITGNPSISQAGAFQGYGTPAPAQQYTNPYGTRLLHGSGGYGSGLAIVGDRGPELVNLPTGSNVYNNQQSQLMGGGFDYDRLGRVIVNSLLKVGR